MKKIFIWTIGIFLMLFVVATIGGSFYMLDYSLSPRADRSDTAACFKKLLRHGPGLIASAVSMPCATLS